MQNVFKAVVLWAVLPSLAHGLTLDLPAPVLAEESRSESFGVPVAMMLTTARPQCRG